MTTLKMEAVSIIDSIEDSEMPEVIAVLRNFKINQKKENHIKEGLEGLEILEGFTGTLPENFNYEKELEEALEEKYGSVN
ncbi:MAG: dihydrodipicolinate reductase [Lachnospiraceae bacterium]|nr:dihydrodipicolinate reductase [Lachnospiraceae bacterium]